jgi:hypothetical protein
MRTYFRPARNPREAKTQAGILDRAARLFEAGYTFALDLCDPFRVGVWNAADPDSDLHTVNLRQRTCDCKAHELYGDCKHRIAVFASPQAREQFRFLTTGQ